MPRRRPSTEPVRENLAGLLAGLPWFMDIPGENFNGVYSANEYLTRNNLIKAFGLPNTDTPITRHKNVAVVCRLSPAAEPEQRLRYQMR